MLKFRPHHFLCTLGFEGKGYSAAFVKNYAEIDQRLKVAPGGDQTVIEVTSHTDSICAPCPSRRELLCESQSKIEALDQAHAEILGLASGDQLTWKEAKTKIAQKMNLGAFHRACEPCSWKALGVCETALRKLQADFTHASPQQSTFTPPLHR